MKIRRLVASISASFDELVSQVENHEAVAEVVLAQLRRDTARVSGHVNRAQAAAESIQQEREQQLQSVARWRARAMRVKAQDREKALQCLQAMKCAEQRAQALAEQQDEQGKLLNELRAQLQRMEARVLQLQDQKLRLSARSALNNSARCAEQGMTGDSERVFARWEESVLAGEYESRPGPSVESRLEQEFRSQEARQALEVELDALCTEQGAQQREDV